MILKWAASGNIWLWKTATLVYLYMDLPFPENKLGKSLYFTLKRNFFKFTRQDLYFIIAFSGRFKKMRFLVSNTFYELCKNKNAHQCNDLVQIYFRLLRYGYYFVNQELICLPYVVCDSIEQINHLQPILAYIITQYKFRSQLYTILRVYLEEIAEYNLSQSMVKHIVAFLYVLSQNDNDYLNDILLFLKETKGGIALNTYRMLENISKQE